LSIGAFWLIAASAGFSILLIAIAGSNNARTVLVAVVVAAMALLAISFSQIVNAMRLPKEPRTPEGRRVARRFAGIVVLEVVGIMLVNTVCYFSGHLSLLIPLDLIVVGIHFFPLARLFSIPRYTVLGALFCTISILTLLIVPAGAHIGAAIARFLISALGCALSAWLISVASLLEVRRLLSGAGRNGFTS